FDGKAANAVAYSAHRGVSTSFFLLRQKSLLRNETILTKQEKYTPGGKTPPIRRGIQHTQKQKYIGDHSPKGGQKWLKVN
ncbi:MAG: hypothetical protein FWB93_03920, partial [Oscillospiraceae bacterium]|nr:hypothetical protein [Oscillospiraceae bacterium]